MKFSEAVDLFVASRQSEGTSPNTIKNYRVTAEKFLRVVGDVDPIRGPWVNGETDGGLTAAHMDTFFGAMLSEGYAEGTINVDYSSLSALCKWLRGRKLLGPDQDPLAGRKALRFVPRARKRLSMGQIRMLLDADLHPRDKILVSLGMFLFLRQSEVKVLRLKDLDLETNTLRVTVVKSKRVDYMRLPLELRPLIREWLTYYTQQAGPLQPDWYLVPAKHHNPFGEDPLKPNKPAGRVSHMVNQALDQIGFPIKDDNGTPLREGMHTLRRSGALLMYRELVASSEPVDEAMRLVQGMLHHASIKTTEHYLGLESVTEARNNILDDRPLYPSLAQSDTVVPIELKAV